MSKLHRHLEDPRRTPQTKPIPGREAEMVKNPEGGYAFKLGDWERLRRFLILGTEGGTFYASEREITRENAEVVRRCIAQDFGRTVASIAEVAAENLAPKNGASIMALALCFARGQFESAETCVLRLALQRVCRTGTHLFEFLDAARSMRGDGRALVGAVREWLDCMSTERLALQMTKYRERAGYTWKDVLRIAHPKPGEDAARQALYRWAVKGELKLCDLTDGLEVEPDTLRRYLTIGQTADADLAPKVRELRAPWEWVPTQATKRRDVYEALFESMPIGATVRQLSKLTAVGVLPDRKADAIARITSEAGIQKGRLHPVNLFVAQKAYEKGRGRHLEWTPDSDIVDALDDAFRLSMQVAEPIEKSVLIAIDSSGSMSGAWGQEAAGAKPIELASAFALALRAQCKGKVDVIAFDTSWRDAPLSSRMRAVDAARSIGCPGGGTDCSLPFVAAMEKGGGYDAVVCFTDNVTWAGRTHPTQALAAARKRNQKLRAIWCSLTATGATLKAPDDALTLDIVGFSPDVPNVVSGFVRGSF